MDEDEKTKKQTEKSVCFFINDVFAMAKNDVMLRIMMLLVLLAMM